VTPRGWTTTLSRRTFLRLCGGTAAAVTTGFALGGCQSDQPIPEVGLDEIVYPGREWQRVSAAQAGMHPTHWPAWLAQQDPGPSTELGERSTLPWGTALTRFGRLVHTWGDPRALRQSASVGKGFTKLALLLASERGLIASLDDQVSDYWTGRGQLDHPRKYLDNEAHSSVTFTALARHEAGFPVTNGYEWRHREGVPDWAVWTGKPSLDNYSHAPSPGNHYSSGGYWRLSQALTVVFGRSLKAVLDEEVMTPIGIEPDAWDWLPGRHVREARDFYPGAPGYGAFIDPPYEIDGMPVVGGGGWVVMSALDLARVGLLVATRGVWDDRRLLRDHELLAGHGGGNNSLMEGVGGGYMASWGQVATTGLDFPPNEVFGPIPARR